MTFDTSELKGRAERLKQTAIDQTVEALIEATASGGGVPPVAQIQQMAETEFADVSSIYDDFLDCPQPEDFAPACHLLQGAMDKLAVAGYEKDPVGGGSAAGTANPELSGVVTTGGYMADWTGDAALTYKSNFADKFEGVTSNEFVTAAVIRHAINAEAAVWQATCDDLDKLSADAQKRMEEVNDRSPADWPMILTVAGAVIAVAAVPVTGGTSLEIAFAVVGAGISVAATGVGAAGEGGKDEQGLETGSAEAIISSLGEALGKIKTHITEGETLIDDKMTQTQTAIANSWDRMCLPRPQYANATSSDYDNPAYNGQSNG